MPEMEHIGSDIWNKICTQCSTIFEVTGSTYIQAQKAMGLNFRHCAQKPDSMKSECKSCESDKNSGRTFTAHREELLAEQDGKCGICCKEISFKNNTAQVDHDHKIGKTRKVLCKLCNRYMATVDDDEWLAKGIVYRDSFRG